MEKKSVSEILSENREKVADKIHMDVWDYVERECVNPHGKITKAGVKKLWQTLMLKSLDQDGYVQGLSGKEAGNLHTMHGEFLTLSQAHGDAMLVHVLVGVTQNWKAFTKYVVKQTGLPNAPVEPRVFYVFHHRELALKFTSDLEEKPKKLNKLQQAMAEKQKQG